MYKQVLTFWFDELQPKQWWIKDPALDRLITDRFAALHNQAARGELYFWRGQAQGRLAEIIILDQFSRNMYRGSPLSFACDAQALALAQEAVSVGADKRLTQMERNFLYMPFMHSESPVIHEVALELFSRNGIEASYDYEVRHKEIIDKFGRYPHRNAVLGRESTAAEIAFLEQPGSAF